MLRWIYRYHLLVTRQTAAVQEIEKIVEIDTGKFLQWRHLHATPMEGSRGMILLWTLDQHGGQAKGLSHVLPAIHRNVA
jgi:hypothetical protein